MSSEPLKSIYENFINRYFCIIDMPITENIPKNIIKILGEGEIAVINIFLNCGGTAVIDESKARKEAKKLNINLIGTIGLLEYSFEQGWITEEETINIIKQLKNEGFRIPSIEGITLQEYINNFN